MEQRDPNWRLLQTLDKVTLQPIVQKALNQEVLTLKDWNYQQINGGFGGGLGGTFIYRFKGHATVQSGVVEWSLILKILHARHDEAPDSTHYWKREAEAYRSGLLEDLPGQIVAAKSYSVIEYPDEACWIWQEEINEQVIDTWRKEDYEQVARHFGQFNGAYLTSHPLPDHPWLSSGWLRKTARVVEQRIPYMQKMLNDPRLQPAFPHDAGQQFSKLWDECAHFLNILDKLPQTFAHQDAVRSNLFLRYRSDREYETVAIDWAYVGKSALGMEMAVLFVVNITLFMERQFPLLRDFDALLHENYVDGLRKAGWQGDTREARLGFITAVICKYFEMLMALSYPLNDLAIQNRLEEKTRHSIETFIEQSGKLFRYVLELADEVNQLMSELNDLGYGVGGS